MKIAYFNAKKPEQAYVKKQLKNHNITFYKEDLEKVLPKLKNTEVLSIFIYNHITKDVLEKLPKLKLITTRSTGYDHIDVQACKARGITVTNVPFYGENTVAEHAFALLLTLSRKIHRSYLRTIHDNFSYEGLTGFDLKGKTIGIIGGGHIGMHAVRMAKGFEMNVLVFDIYKDEKLAKKLGFTYASLNTLLKTADVVSLHCPYNKHTHHIINKKNLKLMKPTALLINTARGPLVDTNALYNELKREKLGGAGLDVIEGEELLREEHELLSHPDKEKHLNTWKRLVQNHALFKMHNVVFTPHNAFNSEEALQRIMDTSIDNVKAFAMNKKANVVKI